jgi:hypothetical protein
LAKRGREGDNLISTEWQLEGVRSWIEAHDEYELPDRLVIEELDVSGARPLARRPGLRRARRTRRGRRGRRHHRRPAEPPRPLARGVRRGEAPCARRRRRRGRGVRSDEPEVDLQDDISQGFARYEVARARKVFRLARARAVRRGVATFPAPAGYDRIPKERAIDEMPEGRLVPNADAPAILEAFRMRAAGASHNAIAEFLTAERGRTRPGREGDFTKGWSRSGVTHLLRNRVTWVS